jgi:multidrug resistance protein MdtO
MDTAAKVMAPLHRPGFFTLLRRELVPSPGRAATTLRVVVGVAIVTMVSMTLQTPETGLSAFMVLFASKENRVLTKMTGILMTLAATVGIGTSLYIYRFTFDYPPLRVPVVAATVFTGMYLSRVFRIGALGFAIGMVVAISQNMGESAPNTDILVRALLWMWVVVVFPFAITVSVSEILLPSKPWARLTGGMIHRLDAAGSVLQRVADEGVAGGKKNAPLAEMATRGSGPLLAELKFAEMKEPALKGRHESLEAVVIASEHLMGAAALLEMRTPQALSGADLASTKALLSEITRLRAEVTKEQPMVPSSDIPVPALPELRELRLALESFRRHLVEETPVGVLPVSRKEKKTLFVPDALTNPAYPRFALKVTLAAMICYLIYNGLDWSGISTAFVTCCIIALENTGASRHKGRLRLIGCAIGGLLGFLSIMYLIPHMVTIVSLVLLVSAVTALAAWVAAGSARLAYAGVQMGFAFYLCTFQGFAPATGFDTIRNRLVGIFLGIIVSSTVFHYIWPESAISQLRTTLARALRGLARLVQMPEVGTPVEADRKTAADLRGKLTKDLDHALQLSEVTLFEDEKADGPPELSAPSLQARAEQVQAIFLVGTALLTDTGLAEWQQLKQPVQEAEVALRASIAKKLEDDANFLETGQPAEAVDFETVITHWNRMTVQIEGNNRIRYLRGLVEYSR